MKVKKKWKSFKWGAKNHPGLGIYIILFITMPIMALKNGNIISGLIAVAFFEFLFGIMFIFTSISVGEANEN